VSIGYRGLEPHRAQFTQVLKDGIPIHADQFGYPEAYYTPPLDTVDRIEFVRGGAALLYGPQPGGALNYVTHRPRTDRPFSGSTLHTAGSDGYYSTFTHLDGTAGRVGYYGYLNHRRSDGIRAENSDYRLTSWLGRLALDATTDSRWLLTLETYEEEHGEPGGLTLATGPTPRTTSSTAAQPRAASTASASTGRPSPSSGSGTSRVAPSRGAPGRSTTCAPRVAKAEAASAPSPPAPPPQPTRSSARPSPPSEPRHASVGTGALRAATP
jgi:hypothetical protein